MKWLKTNLWFFIVIFLCGLVLWPLLRDGFFVSDDGDWMIIRFSAFFQSFREGQFPVRYLGRLNYEYGYPVSNFLYPGFLYLGSFIRALGVSFVDTVKIIFKNAKGFHDWTLDEFNAATKQLTVGQSETIQFVADKAGTFEYYCSVGNHRQQGMVGKLVVL